MDEEKIKKQAKEIMDEFMKALEKLDEKGQEFGSERERFLRNPKGKKSNPEFRRRMLRNAPKSKDGYIAAEKKKW